MENWLEKIIIGTATTIVGGVVVWHLTEGPVENRSATNIEKPVPVEEPVGIEPDLYDYSEDESVRLGDLLKIGEVAKIHPQFFIITITYELAPSAEKLFVESKNGMFIVAKVQRRYEKNLSATALNQDEIKIGDKVFVKKN